MSDISGETLATEDFEYVTRIRSQYAFCQSSRKRLPIIFLHILIRVCIHQLHCWLRSLIFPPLPYHVSARYYLIRDSVK